MHELDSISCRTGWSINHNRWLTNVKRHRISTYWCQAFAIVGSSTWGSLPDPVHNPNATETGFRFLLKTKNVYAKRSFRCAAPSVWNSLPASVIRSDSLSVFKSRLKTFLFRRSFNEHTQPTAASASEVMNLWRFTNMFIILIIFTLY